MEMENVEQEEQRTRRRKRNPEMWNKNVIKRARVEGTAYRNHRKNEVPARMPGK